MATEEDTLALSVKATLLQWGRPSSVHSKSELAELGRVLEVAKGYMRGRMEKYFRDMGE